MTLVRTGLHGSCCPAPHHDCLSPLVYAADCPAGAVSCCLPRQKQWVIVPVAGKRHVCGYTSSGSAKYCYTTTRVTQKPAAAGFTGSECPQVSGLTFIGGITYAQAGIPNRDGLNCQVLRSRDHVQTPMSRAAPIS